MREDFLTCCSAIPSKAIQLEGEYNHVTAKRLTNYFQHPLPSLDPMKNYQAEENSDYRRAEQTIG
jgi:hypothetical protein